MVQVQHLGNLREVVSFAERTTTGGLVVEVRRGAEITAVDKANPDVIVRALGGGRDKDNPYDFGVTSKGGQENYLFRQQEGGSRMKTWDVFFDRVTGTRTQVEQALAPVEQVATPYDPIVLDLNRNGQADVTGNNLSGDGVITSGVRGFDLDLNDRQWAQSLLSIPAGSLAGTTARLFVPGQPGPAQTLSSEQGVEQGAVWLAAGGTAGQRLEFRDGNGTLVGEVRFDNATGRFRFFTGNVNQNEWTKAWDAAGGDGLLVWDVDGDGKITSGIELMGHADLAGANVFANGYQKLAHYFDHDGNGKVAGQELAGLQIWEDRDGDGVTDAGELVGLAARFITSLSTVHGPDLSSTASTPLINAKGQINASGLDYVHGFSTHFEAGNWFHEMWAQWLMINHQLEQSDEE